MLFRDPKTAELVVMVLVGWGGMALAAAVFLGVVWLLGRWWGRLGCGAALVAAGTAVSWLFLMSPWRGSV